MLFQDGIYESARGDAPDQRILLRVGINIGDVIVGAHDIFGDGVNIAARLEGIAEPGGICLSSSVHDQVRGKIGAEFADLGAQNLKNIATPVRAFAVVPDAPGGANGPPARRIPTRWTRISRAWRVGTRA
jgi:class 3 adenylate cyclase